MLLVTSSVLLLPILLFLAAILWAERVCQERLEVYEAVSSGCRVPPADIIRAIWLPSQIEILSNPNGAERQLSECNSLVHALAEIPDFQSSANLRVLGRLRLAIQTLREDCADKLEAELIRTSLLIAKRDLDLLRRDYRYFRASQGRQ